MSVTIDHQIAMVEACRDSALPCDYPVLEKAAMSLRYLREYREIFVAVVALKKAHPEFTMELIGMLGKIKPGGEGDTPVDEHRQPDAR